MAPRFKGVLGAFEEQKMILWLLSEGEEGEL